MVQRHAFPRITLDPAVMGGKACVRGLRVTVGAIVGLIASGETVHGVLKAYPYLEEADVREALSYAAWVLQERDVVLRPSNELRDNE
jgi:uncharacterized protein (DUF433 family)